MASFGIAYGAINSVEGLFPPVIQEATGYKSKVPEVVLTISYLVNGLTVLFINLLLLYVDLGTNIMLLGCVIFTIFVLFPLVFSMTESPVFLFRKGKVIELVDSFYTISKRNFKNLTKKDFLDEIVGAQLSEKISQEKKIKIRVLHTKKPDVNGKDKKKA